MGSGPVPQGHVMASGSGSASRSEGAGQREGHAREERGEEDAGEVVCPAWSGEGPLTRSRLRHPGDVRLASTMRQLAELCRSIEQMQAAQRSEGVLGELQAGEEARREGQRRAEGEGSVAESRRGTAIPEQRTAALHAALRRQMRWMALVQEMLRQQAVLQVRGG